MSPYWTYFSLTLIGLFAPFRLQGWIKLIVMSLFLLTTVVFIGLRDGISGDWLNYLYTYNKAATDGFAHLWHAKDRGYMLLNILVGYFDLGLPTVNFLCASALVGGLFIFCRALKTFWLPWVFATPYVLFIIGMGYTRQSAALGLVFIAITQLRRGSWGRFLISIGCASLFHFSAVLVFPLIIAMIGSAQVSRGHKLLRSKLNAASVVALALGIALLSAIILFLFLDLFAGPIKSYIKTQHWHSSGAILRTGIGALMGLSFLLCYRYLEITAIDKRLFIYMSILSIGTVLTAFIFSTAADRLAIYWVPLQLYVVSLLPFLSEHAGRRALVSLGVVTFSIAYLWGWFAYAEHAMYWIPFRNFVF